MAHRTRRERWGWWTLVVVGALITLNGLALAFIVTSPSTFESDTGADREAVAQEYPGVVEELDARGVTLAILLAGFGLLMLVVALGGLKEGPAWAWRASWVPLALFLVVAVRAFVGGNPEIGGFYLFWSVSTLVGLVLARPPGEGRAQAG